MERTLIRAGFDLTLLFRMMFHRAARKIERAGYRVPSPGLEEDSVTYKSLVPKTASPTIPTSAAATSQSSAAIADFARPP